ncbi:MAG: leucyl aminopeptidase [Ardenticatenia bacterium]|nr:leucyl aminopeptidase [Ardenticatenia bacterium]
MNVRVAVQDPLHISCDWLLIGVGDGDDVPGALDDVLGGLLRELVDRGEFDPNGRDVTVIHPRGALPARRLIVAPMGRERTAEAVRRAVALGGRKIRRLGGGHLAIAPLQDVTDPASAFAYAQAVAEGLFIGTYEFEAFRTNQDRRRNTPITNVDLLIPGGDQVSSAEAGLGWGRTVAEGVNLTRTLVNEPANVATPGRLASAAEEIAAGTGHIRCRVFGEKEVEQEGMGAFLGVARGSDNPPAFIVLEHRLEEFPDTKPVVLVGKAITFDSGGYNIKPSEGLWKMKSDMSGGAAVLGTFAALARLEVPLPVVGLVPAAENLVSGHAYRPGDILHSLSSQTIEILNTDAEGRLILADALAYAERYAPRCVVDMATLTGAMMVALGYSLTGYFCNDDTLAAQLEAAAKRAGEPLWRMPLWDEYDAYLESKVADMCNVGIRWGGAITAALFLRRFVGSYPWAHLDIAGTAFATTDRKPTPPLTPYGATGVPVRTLVEWLRALTE